MKPAVKSIIKLALLMVLAATLTGCYNKSAEDLYSLPRASKEYQQLQQKIDAVLASGAEYSAPASGSNRKPVQLEDLNGDGTDEAVAFFKVNGDKPLRIYIFRSVGKGYEKAAEIDGNGTTVDSISYIDMDGDGIKEIVVGWRMNPTLKMMNVYSMHDFQPESLVSTDYSEYTVYDMNGDGNRDLIALKLTDSASTGVVRMYSLMTDGEMVSSVAQLSKGIESISRVRAGKLRDNAPAIFVESVYGGNNIEEDIFAYKSGSIKNITVNPESGKSEDTRRTLEIYTRDLNGDGVMDVPFPRLLKSQTETSYYAIDWYDYESNGQKKLVMSTYHDNFDGWYLVLPGDWGDNVTVRREDAVPGERSLVFSRVTGKDTPVQDFLTIYTLSGDNRGERASITGRFSLLDEGETIYAAEIMVDVNSFPLSISSNSIKNNFRIIYSDWITGET